MPTTFYCEYKILPNQATRDACMTYFAGMDDTDDARELGSVNLLGRWSTVGEGRGFCVAEADDATAIARWLAGWIPMADIYTVPVLNDNEHRELILGDTPSFTVPYDMVHAEAKAGESLYFIKYQFKCGKTEEGFKAFASMTEEMDNADSGECTSYGRWHVPSEGCGYAICSAPSAMAVYKWAYNWRGLCKCEIQAVTGDKITREILRSQPGFEEKHAILMEQLGIENTGPHHVTATFTFKDAEKKTAFTKIIESPDGLAKTRAWPGNESIEVFSDAENPLVLIIQQTWQKKSDHASYMKHREETGMLDKVKEFGTLEVRHLGTTNY